MPAGCDLIVHCVNGRNQRTCAFGGFSDLPHTGRNVGSYSGDGRSKNSRQGVEQRIGSRAFNQRGSRACFQLLGRRKCCGQEASAWCMMILSPRLCWMPRTVAWTYTQLLKPGRLQLRYCRTCFNEHMRCSMRWQLQVYQHLHCLCSASCVPRMRPCQSQVRCGPLQARRL